MAAFVVLSAVVSSEASASSAYPVRICSPEIFRSDGPGTFNTHSPNIPVGTQVYSKQGGSVSYGAVGDFSMSNPVANCAAKNTNNAGIMNYGMRLLTDTQVDYAVGREAGIEIQAPAGEKIAQVQFDARAAQGVQGAQDGISGTGSRLVREFVGGANPEHGSLVPGNTSISPLRLCQRVAGFPVSSR